MLRDMLAKRSVRIELTKVEVLIHRRFVRKNAFAVAIFFDRRVFATCLRQLRVGQITVVVIPTMKSADDALRVLVRERSQHPVARVLPFRCYNRKIWYGFQKAGRNNERIW